MTLQETTVQTIDNVNFTTPSELKNGIYARYNTPFELAKYCSRDTLRRFAKEFAPDTRDLSKSELVTLVWGQIESELEKVELGRQFLVADTATLTAQDVVKLVDSDASTDNVASIIHTSFNGFADSTIVKTLLPKYNKILDGLGNRGSQIKVLLHCMCTSKIKDVNRESRKYINDEVGEVTFISQEVIETFIANVVSQIDTRDWLCLGIALALLTGRRCSEIHGFGGFDPVDGHNVLFTGQLKTKTEDPTPYIIPVADTDMVMTLQRKLEVLGKRQKTSSYVRQTMSSNYTRHKEYFKGIGLEMFKDTRVVYALYHGHYTRPDNVSPAAYTARILGYNIADIQTAQSYAKFEYESFRRGIESI